MTINFEEDAQSVGDLSRVGTLASRAEELKQRLEGLEAEVRTLKKELMTIETEHLPEAMEGANCREFTTPGGMKITLRKDIGGLPSKADEERYQAALEELIKHGGADIIKSVITIPFEAGEGDESAEFAKRLQGITNHQVIRSEDVHHSALKAWLRRSLEDGVPLDLDRLGIWMRSRAYITKS